MSGTRPTGAVALSSVAIDLVSIRQALAVADCLSFRRAGAVLGVEQSTVSRRIRTLEDFLGVSLFERHRAGVRVTEAGHRFFDQTRGALLQLDNAVKAAGMAGRGAMGHLSIGILSSMAGGFLRDVIAAYSTRHDGVAIEILEGASDDHIALVQQRRIDVVCVTGQPVIPNCDVAKLWTERILVALPAGHPLCAQREVEWPALREENFIFRQCEKGRALQSRVIDRLSTLEHKPNVRMADVSRETLMNLVSLRMGVSLMCEGALAHSYPDVTFRPIAGSDEELPFSAVWSPRNDNPAFRRFLSLARAFAKERMPGTISSTQ